MPAPPNTRIWTKETVSKMFYVIVSHVNPSDIINVCAMWMIVLFLSQNGKNWTLVIHLLVFTVCLSVCMCMYVE